MAKLKKGDVVVILSGRDRGKQGKILKILTARQAALVERVNLVKHFERRTRADQPWGIVEREGPIALANLALLCPRCKRPARIGWSLTDGSKTRMCKRCQEIIRG